MQKSCQLMRKNNLQRCVQHHLSKSTWSWKTVLFPCYSTSSSENLLTHEKYLFILKIGLDDYSSIEMYGGKIRLRPQGGGGFARTRVFTWLRTHFASHKYIQVSKSSAQWRYKPNRTSFKVVHYIIRSEQYSSP